MAESSNRMNSSFVCLHCAKSKLGATAATRYKSSSLSARTLSQSSYRIPFYLSGRSKVEALAFELTWRKQLVKCHTGDGKHYVACRCGTPAANPVAGCHNQGLQSVLWQLLYSLLCKGRNLCILALTENTRVASRDLSLESSVKVILAYNPGKKTQKPTHQKTPDLNCFRERVRINVCPDRVLKCINDLL